MEVEEAVVAVQGDRAGDAEEGRGGHVVAADGQPILEAAERAAACVVVGGGLALPRRPEGDVERDRHHGEEQANGQGSIARGERDQKCGVHRPASRSNSSRSSVASGSNDLLAWRA